MKRVIQAFASNELLAEIQGLYIWAASEFERMQTIGYLCVQEIAENFPDSRNARVIFGLWAMILRDGLVEFDLPRAKFYMVWQLHGRDMDWQLQGRGSEDGKKDNGQLSCGASESKRHDAKGAGRAVKCIRQGGEPLGTG